MALTDVGRHYIISALIGEPHRHFDHENSFIGVGDSTVPFDRKQTNLLGENVFLAPMDDGYPMRDPEDPLTVVFRSTFYENMANFAWCEWALFNNGEKVEYKIEEVISRSWVKHINTRVRARLKVETPSDGNNDLQANINVRKGHKSDLNADIVVQNDDKSDMASHVYIRRNVNNDLKSNVTIKGNKYNDIKSSTTIRRDDINSLESYMCVRQCNNEDLNSSISIKGNACSTVEADLDVKGKHLDEIILKQFVGAVGSELEIADSITICNNVGTVTSKAVIPDIISISQNVSLITNDLVMPDVVSLEQNVNTITSDAIARQGLQPLKLNFFGIPVTLEDVDIDTIMLVRNVDLIGQKSRGAKWVFTVWLSFEDCPDEYDFDYGNAE